MPNLKIEIQQSSWEKFSLISRSIIKGLLILFILILFLGSMGLASDFNGKTFSTEYVDWYDNVIYPESEGVSILDQPQIAFIPVEGMIINDQMAGMYEGISSKIVRQMLNDAKLNKQVKAVVLMIDSPGGTVLDSELIAQEVNKVKKVKPVYAVLESMAASGGYYIASQADQIFAYNETITGSIGVVMQVPQAKKLMDKLGVEMINITSGNYKSMGSPFNEFTNDHKEVFQGMVDESYEQFIKIVSEGRGMDLEKVRKISDGRIYSGKQALELGLVDHLGGLNSLEDFFNKQGLGDIVRSKYFIPLSPFEEMLMPVGKMMSSFSTAKQNIMIYYILN